MEFQFTGQDNNTPSLDLEFQCTLDGVALGSCSSPEDVEVLTDGAHTFTVAAVDLDGNVDPTPATHTRGTPMNDDETTRDTMDGVHATDTPTGTDPDAKWSGPGYEDKSFGQAVAQDLELVDRIAAETDSEAEAEARFAEESAGAPALDRQKRGDGPAVGARGDN